VTTLRWGLIGFGEVGSAFGRHIARVTGKPVCLADPLLNQNPQPGYIRDRLAGFEFRVLPDIPSLVDRCDVVICAVPPSSAMPAVELIAKAWSGGLCIELSSTSPNEKQRAAALFDRPDFVDGAILDSVARQGEKTPLVLAGPRAEEARELFDKLHFRTSVIGQDVGAASALKMCRSIFMKGLECLYVETLIAAGKCGISELVFGSIQETFRAYGFRPLAEMLVTTHAIHCGRRADEMDEVVSMLEDLRLPSTMTKASYKFLQASSATGVTRHFACSVPSNLEEVVAYLADHQRGE